MSDREKAIEQVMTHAQHLRIPLRELVKEIKTVTVNNPVGFDFTCEKGKTRDLLLDATGKLIEVEDETDLKSIPSAAREAIQKKAAGGTVQFPGQIVDQHLRIDRFAEPPIDARRTGFDRKLVRRMPRDREDF